MRKGYMAWMGLCLISSLLWGCGQVTEVEKDTWSAEPPSESEHGDKSAESAATGKTGGEMQPQDMPKDGKEIDIMEKYAIMKVDTGTVYQTMESFGTSGAWWRQYVGGFTECVDDSGVSSRERIAELLFDREEGIGRTCYRYNLGAGSAESGKGEYSDIHRRAQCFETSAGVYDFTKDANAVWFLKKAVELGVEEVVLFSNSPLERFTDNGKAQMDKGKKSNLSPENYQPFAAYVIDVAEHFLEEGIPVKFLSPINEPQWEWTGGQEGAHYEPSRTAEVYLGADGEEELVLVFVNEGMSSREFFLEGCQGYERIASYETSDIHDLKCVLDGTWSGEPVTVPARAVVTVVLRKN